MANDIFARIGGEEFATLLPQSASEAVWLAERVRTAVEIASYPVEQQTTRLTVSVGIASLSEDTTDLAALLKEADVALYRAKQAGRNRSIGVTEG